MTYRWGTDIAVNCWRSSESVQSCGPLFNEKTGTLTLGRTRKFKPLRCDKERGGGGWWKPSLEFLICCSISKRYCLWWKAFALLNKMRNILWVVALLEAFDVSNNGQRITNQVKNCDKWYVVRPRVYTISYMVWTHEFIAELHASGSVTS